MQNILHNWVKNINTTHKKKRLWIQGSCVAGCLVVFCTFYALILPAITMEYGERTLDCPLSVHAHTDACKNEEGAQICGQADFVVHAHADGCYDAEGTLTCLLPEVEEHTHTEDCYTSETELICTEGEHFHGDACYESKSVLTCEKEEITLHNHGEDCYETNEDEEEVLICTMLEVMEHVHSDGCFVEVDADADSEEESQPASLPAETETTALTVAEKGDADAVVMAADTGDAAVVASGTCGTNASWALTDDGVLTISGTGEMKNYSNYGSYFAPWYDYYSSITSVVIGEEITSIGNYAFYLCYKVTSIAIPDGVTSIGMNAFFSCSGLTSITIPESVTTIGSDAFCDCSGLTTITIPQGVTSIGDNAFGSCRSLTNIYVDAKNASYASIDGVLFDKAVTILERYPERKADISYAIPEGVNSIGRSAFSGCDNLTSITIPEGVTSIGYGAFSGCENLTSVAISAGVTSIGNSAFHNCSSLNSIAIPDGVTYIGKRAFAYCRSLTSITIPSSVKSIGADAFIGSIERIVIQTGTVSVASGNDSVLEEIVIGERVDELKLEILEIFTSGSDKIEQIAFAGPNYLHCTGEGYSLGKLSLIAGEYYVDEYGVLYRLNEDGTASVWYAPETLSCEDYVILESVPAEADVETNYTVTAIYDCAFQNCTALKSVTIPDGITGMGSRAFAYASSLSSVNGETSLHTVLNKWASAGANSSTFAGTALWESGLDDTYSVTADPIEVFDSTGRKITLSIGENKEVLTGQNVQSVLTIDEGDKDSVDVIRIYFQFESNAGSLDYKLGTHDFKINDSTKIAVNVCQSNAENIYYVEIPCILAGQTLNLNLPSKYANYSAGGTAMIWLEVLSKEEAQNLGNGIIEPKMVHLATWGTKVDTFPVSKETSTGTVNVKGDGTNSGLVYLEKLTYTISMSRDGDTLDYGKDLMTSADFVDTITLPKPFEWRKDVVEAIRNGNYDRHYYGSCIYWRVKVNGEWEDLACLDTTKTENELLRVDDDGNIQFGWTYTNSFSDTEIENFSEKFEICSQMIVAESAKLAADMKTARDSVTYTFENNISVTQHFTHSGDQNQSASAKKEISVGAADYTIEKWGGDSANMGEEMDFTITLMNETALPYTALDYVTDSVPSYSYITPADMEIMFCSDTYGKNLAISITDATLTETVPRTVTGTDGQQYTITQQHEGSDTDYAGKATTDSSMITDSATITIGWSDDKSHLVLTASYENTVITRTIGTGKDCGSIQEALNSVGYLATCYTRYICTWNQQGQTLYSGERRNFYVRTTVKDTFMRLTGDQDWYIINGLQYATEVKNSAYAYTTDESKKSYDDYYLIYRDFTLNKDAYLDGELVEEIETGDVLSYRIDVTHAGDAAYDALPLVDNMEGGQVLLVLGSENTALSDLGLETYETDGEVYYLLNKPGTYERVQVGTHLADRVVVTETGSGLDTMIYWYLTEVSGETTVTVKYPALVSPEKAGLTMEDSTFELSNEVWLNDHETHRLYDEAFLYGTILRMNKYIVTNVDSSELSGLSQHDYTKDILSERTNIHAGETVVYRLLLGGLGGPVTVKGTSMYDVLPASLNNYWSRGNITVTYVQTKGTEATIQNGDAWYIETDPENKNQQYLRWREDFSATIDGTLYIYVTLTCPSGSQWADYGHAYGKQDVSNTFHVYQLQDEVFHSLSVPAEVLLQKGVYKTGVAVGRSYMEATDTQSLWYYTNETQAEGLVTYYVTLYNGGDTRVYLSTLQDVLPRGFTLHALYTAGGSIESINVTGNEFRRNYGYNTLATLAAPDDKPIIYKQAYIHAATTNDSNGREIVSFSFSNANDYGNLCYDTNLGKYYLDVGEVLVFAYHCNTNGYADTEDMATNTIAMPYYDYNGAGVNLNTGILVDRREANGLNSNNGSRAAITTGQAELLGMDCTGADNSTQWLSSDVTVRRGDILPGITKSAQKPFAAPTDAVSWNIQVSNSGNYDMRNYTITDVMMAPYQFTGSVGYKIYFNASESDYAENTNLFRFDERTWGETVVTITSKKGSTQLTVNGEYQELTSSISGYDVTLLVRLSQDANGNEVLSIRFPEDEYKMAAIPAGGTAVMTLQTKNISNSYSNTTYFNTSYITPSQPFDTGAVSQGNYTIFDEKDSVVSEANVAVAYGYATSSQKSVAELENLENKAVSTGSTNSIVLPDAESHFRYTLTVNNTGGDSASQAMDKLVLIDNLPQKNDHVTFYPDILRYSEFKVDFADADELTDADGLNFAVSVNGTSLDSSKYVVEFSEKTEFDSEDWKGTGTEGWFSMSDITTLSNMRSVRVKILDENGTLIPANAVITVSFNARIDSTGVPPPSAVAWNSFGYRYSLLGDSTELEAAPQKVGVKMPSVPALVKELVDSNGDAYSAREDATFYFVIYEGEAITLPEGYAEADVFTALGEKNFTVVDLTVEAGKSTSNAVKLDDQRCWSYTDGVLSETTEIWSWTHLSRYTIVELPLESDSVYTFDAFDRIHPNNYTFSYNAASNRTITCSNIRDVWEILVSKTCETTEKPLSGAVFGIYSTKESDKISDENFEALTANLRTKPEKKVESWYLMDIQTTNADGTIRWNGLTEESYYVQELQAPDGYSFEQEGKVLTRGNGNSVTIEVTNKPGYKLPETGGPGTKLLTTAGLLLMMTALVLLFKRRWGGAIIG